MLLPPSMGEEYWRKKQTCIRGYNGAIAHLCQVRRSAAFSVSGSQYALPDVAVCPLPWMDRKWRAKYLSVNVLR